MIDCITTFLKSLGIAILVYFVQVLAAVAFIGDFMRSNLLNILITLMAINTATIAVILSKMYEISQNYKKNINDAFGNTKSQLLLSIREQISLIGASLILSILSKKTQWFAHSELLNAGLEILLTTVFIYALFILYDTAVAVLNFYD